MFRPCCCDLHISNRALFCVSVSFNEVFDCNEVFVFQYSGGYLWALELDKNGDFTGKVNLTANLRFEDIFCDLRLRKQNQR